MNDELKNRIKAYLIRLDIQSEEELQQARYNVAYHSDDCYALSLYRSIIRRKQLKKIMKDVWALLEYIA